MEIQKTWLAATAIGLLLPALALSGERAETFDFSRAGDGVIGGRNPAVIRTISTGKENGKPFDSERQRNISLYPVSALNRENLLPSKHGCGSIRRNRRSTDSSWMPDSAIKPVSD